ncbi:hypothetical protein QBC46DRAFT_322451 [Diplogelasinospora grovesii]|uniref:Uncharacterized protein n=1 Tax=Diplogelasinospora grovesii TaxID=303347 RepID=A0AAN6S0G6_9PEZI|nr:hypothetical protein QBC46DRAFT_322451 [Diplogelasinospora grovesii]
MKEGVVSETPRETGSTFDNIYDQYLPSTPTETPSPIENHNNGFGIGEAIPYGENGHQGDSSPSIGEYDDGAYTHRGRGDVGNMQSPEIRKSSDGINPGKHRFQLRFSPGDAPQESLPQLPSVHGGSQRSGATTDNNPLGFDSPGPSLGTVSDSQGLLNGTSNGAQIDRAGGSAPNYAAYHLPSLVPRRVLSIKAETAQDSASASGGPYGHLVRQQSLRDGSVRESYASQCGLSNGGFSTGGLTTESDEDPFKYDRRSYAIFLGPSKEREVSAALHRVNSTSTHQSPQNTPHREYDRPPMPPLPDRAAMPTFDKARVSNNPYLNKVKGQFYQNAVLESAWKDDYDPNEVKIPVHQPQNPPVGLSYSQDDGQGAQEAQSPMEHLSSLYHAQTVVSDGADWETVGDSVGQFDSNRAYVSGTDYHESRIGRSTGSSIAGYSETDSVPTPPPFDAFSSTDRILQHPMPGDGLETRHLRTLKDTGRPIFLPQPRTHRVNGYPQDSCRVFTETTTGSSGTSARAYPSEKLSAPSRLDGFRKPGNSRNPYNQIERSTKPKQSRYALTNGRPLQTPVPDSSFTSDNSVHHQRDASLGASSPHLFNFPLVPLPEAAKLQAIRRLSDEEDLTFISVTGTRQASSVISQPAQKTTPTTPNVLPTRPLPVHSRGPTPYHMRDSAGMSITGDELVLAFIRILLTLPADRSISGYGPEVSPMSPLSSTNSRGFGQPGLPRSLRNPFASVHDSTRSSADLRSPVSAYDPPHLWPREGRNRFHRMDDSSELHHINLHPNRAYGYSSEDAYLSWETRKRRQCYYYLMCALCVFPFFAPLIYKGMFNSILGWYTKGETDTLNRRQRRNVMIVGFVIGALWLVAITITVTLLVSRSK